MSIRKKSERCLVVLLLSCVAGAADAAPIAPGYVVSEVTTPGAATGDVLVAGGALFVGVGSFGVGTQSVVRIDGGGTTTIASQFNSLGGFAYDAVNDRLIVLDNGLEAGDFVGGGPATTGDTIYGIDLPFATPGVVPIADVLELAPSGSVPGAAAVRLDPSNADIAFVTDSFDSDLKQVDLLAGTTSVLQSGLGFAAGLEVLGSTLFIGDVDTGTFLGKIWTVPVASPGSARTLLVDGLSGQFHLAIGADGNLLATAAGNLLSIDPLTGASTVVASGFGFATGLAADGDDIYVIDGTTLYHLAVPEPGATALVLCMAAGLALRGRRS